MTSSWGGKRLRAGRPAGSGPFGEATHVMRVPGSLVNSVKTFIHHRGFALPLYATKVSAGLPSPSDDYLEGALDLNDHLIKHPDATFCVRVTGDSMIKAGIFPDDILIVDRSLTPTHGKIIIAMVNGELTVKRLYQRDGRVELQPENDAYSPIVMASHDELTTWGVVTNVIHPV